MYEEVWNYGFPQELAHFVRCVKHEEPPQVTGEDGKAVLEAIFAAYVADDLDLTCEPGKFSNYANAHYLALASIIEEVSGEPYETYVGDHVLSPLAMESTHFQLSEAQERYAKGQYPTARIDELIARMETFRGASQEAFVLHKGESFSTLDEFRVLPPWGGLLGTPSDLTPSENCQAYQGYYL